MKYLKQFETFSNTGVDDTGSEVLPKYNPKIRQDVVNFLDDLSPNNRPLVFKWLGLEEPSVTDPDFDEKFDNIKDQVIDFFESNPNIQVSSIDVDKFTIPKRGGDGIPRVQNIGGVGR